MTSCADWFDHRDNLRDVQWEDIFEVGASAASREFCDKVEGQINVYIPKHKYQVKRHSSPWFFAACASVIVH